jgi:hypothetical protein
MEHPLIGNIDDMSLDDLQTKVSDLTKKLGIAHRMGNAQLCAQIQMALATYQNKYQEKLRKSNDKQSAPDFSGKIDIS